MQLIIISLSYKHIFQSHRLCKKILLYAFMLENYADAMQILESM